MSHALKILMSFLLFAGPLAAAEGGHLASDTTFRRYLDEVYETSLSSHRQPISRDAWYTIGSNARDAYADHVYYDGARGGYYTDEQLTHFLDEAYKFRGLENRYGPSTDYRTRYRVRHSHIGECHVCNMFTRLFFRYTTILLTPFYPSYAYYGGSRLGTYRDYVYYQGQYCPISFDYYSSSWKFTYRGYRYPLTF